ncbi:hypothetical protein NADFUDRAFT_81941 [Nadsonia fulvescens var. elongata DSM 6958]|uniref:Mitochondrial distribution and morphology protein 34 n=1 Tax=Nadsonia fulvescens var. elongata DSM 6958 TaxID=857566 RepID=A0A1E3PR98_9ASCO|nr:hypothetical protein NADFUDRAFT_81941 [Nadsonia fulvescens var. elongata DSM 6958]
MSFQFNWSSFKEQNFYERAKVLLTDALNKSNKPPILVDRIVVKDLDLGDTAPNLEILEIGDLADDRFRGIFKLNYDGNASITLSTKVQANPLNVYEQGLPSFASPQFISSCSSLAIPLNLTLSQIKLSGIIILVFSKAKGLTLVFRNDPLESITVSSTFDQVPVIAKFLQVQIENQIRLLFREELPTIIHRLSQKWTPAGSAILRASTLSTDTTDGKSLSSTSPKLKPVSLMDINPDLPALSPNNMLRISALCASQRTLSLFTPSIPDVFYRGNLERFNHSDDDDASVHGDDTSDIARMQSRNYYRHHHSKPKRRIINLRKKSVENVLEQKDREADVNSSTHTISSSVTTTVTVEDLTKQSNSMTINDNAKSPISLASSTSTPPGGFPQKLPAVPLINKDMGLSNNTAGFSLSSTKPLRDVKNKPVENVDSTLSPSLLLSSNYIPSIGPIMLSKRSQMKNNSEKREFYPNKRNAKEGYFMDYFNQNGISTTSSNDPPPPAYVA